MSCSSPWSLLEGEALAERLHAGTLSVSETMPVGLGMLAAR